MPSTFAATRDHGSPAAVPWPSPRWLALALTLLLACAKGATLPSAPTDVLHFPAWIAPFDDQLLVVNLDQDLAYDNGALVAIDATPPEAQTSPVFDRPVLGGTSVPNMSGQILVVDEATAGDCMGHFATAFPVPFALVAGRLEDDLIVVSLQRGKSPPFQTVQTLSLSPSSASEPFGIGFTCSVNPATGQPTPRAWVGYMVGQSQTGYVTRMDLNQEPGAPGSMVQVNVGRGTLRSFAYDGPTPNGPGHDRLYFTGREVVQSAPIRWIQVGAGCPQEASGTNFVQDERKGGCHVDGGFDLSAQFRGAEPNDIALSSDVFDCTSRPSVGKCRRAYVSVRMYDADIAALEGGRPSGDVGGKLFVLELPEGGLGRPEPQVVGQFDIGVQAGAVHVIPRPGKHDLVAVTALDDSLLWLYDDELGQMVKVFGRDANGVPVLGHQPTAIASQALDADHVRLFVTSYWNGWVSAVNVPLTAPASAELVVDTSTGFPWRLGVAP